MFLLIEKLYEYSRIGSTYFDRFFFTGPDSTRDELLPSIMNIYNALNDDVFLQHCNSEVAESVLETLYNKFFLVQLLARLGLHVFLESFSRPLAECLAVHSSCAGKSRHILYLLT